MFKKLKFENRPLISICCLTYNHKPYIRNTIEGLLKQKRDFQIEIIIHDDASTDGTDLILKDYENNYPGLIKLIFQKENQYSKGIKPIFKYVFPLVIGKYFAMCEGDDFWTDPYKIQKQVTFLENNPDCIGVSTNFKTINKEGKVIKKRSEFNLISEGNRQLILGLPKTLTVMYRNIPEVFSLLANMNNLYNGDEALAQLMRNWGPIGFIDDVTGVYRKHDNGIFSSKNQITRNLMTLESCENLKSFLIQNNLKHDLDYKIQDYYCRMIASYLLKLNLPKALYYSRRIEKFSFLNFKKIILYLLAYLKGVFC